jgi:hypothetical protein
MHHIHAYLDTLIRTCTYQIHARESLNVLSYDQGWHLIGVYPPGEPLCSDHAYVMGSHPRAAALSLEHCQKVRGDAPAGCIDAGLLATCTCSHALCLLCCVCVHIILHIYIYTCIHTYIHAKYLRWYTFVLKCNQSNCACLHIHARCSYVGLAKHLPTPACMQPIAVLIRKLFARARAHTHTHKQDKHLCARTDEARPNTRGVRQTSGQARRRHRRAARP